MIKNLAVYMYYSFDGEFFLIFFLFLLPAVIIYFLFWLSELLIINHFKNINRHLINLINLVIVGFIVVVIVDALIPGGLGFFGIYWLYYSIFIFFIRLLLIISNNRKLKKVEESIGVNPDQGKGK